jgi:hypothetical protein
MGGKSIRQSFNASIEEIMSLTNVLAISETITINDHRFVGQMLSRNQRITTSEILTVVPFEFKLRPMNYLRYSQSRGLLNSLRIPDKALEQYLCFSETGWENYIQYQGNMTSLQVGACQWQTSSDNKILVLGNLPTMPSTEYIVKAGDFCQVGRYSYIATDDVLRGGAGTTEVNIPVHRSLIDAVTSPINAVIGEYGTTVALGGNSYTGVTFPVILRDYPTYSLVPIYNDSFIQWSGEFSAFESVL